MSRNVLTLVCLLTVILLTCGARLDCGSGSNETEEVLAINEQGDPIKHRKQSSMVECGDRCIQMVEDFENRSYTPWNRSATS